MAEKTKAKKAEAVDGKKEKALADETRRSCCC